MRAVDAWLAGEELHAACSGVDDLSGEAAESEVRPQRRAAVLQDPARQRHTGQPSAVADPTGDQRCQHGLAFPGGVRGRYQGRLPEHRGGKLMRSDAPGGALQLRSARLCPVDAVQLAVSPFRLSIHRRRGLDYSVFSKQERRLAHRARRAHRPRSRVVRLGRWLCSVLYEKL